MCDDADMNNVLCGAECCTFEAIFNARSCRQLTIRSVAFIRGFGPFCGFGLQSALMILEGTVIGMLPSDPSRQVRYTEF